MKAKPFPEAPPARRSPTGAAAARLDPEHLPATIYVSWQLSAEGQHAAVNWKYDVASHTATPLTAAEAADVAQRIAAGSIGTEARAFFHVVPHAEGRATASVGYCWGSARGTFAFTGDGPVLTGDLTVHGY